MIGYQEISWDGRDHDGYRIANGTYYAKLIVKNKSKKLKKLIKIAKLEGY
jgi:flagellar hook assembly protein FlgD